MLFDQAGGLQRLFQEAIRHRHPVLPPGNLVEVADIEAAIPLAIEPQQPLHLGRRHPAHRGAVPTLVDQAYIPVGLIALPPAPQVPSRDPQNVRRPEPMDFPAERFQQHFLDRHRPLPRGLWMRHGASQLRCRVPTAAKVEAERSLALGSGQIMYSLHRVVRSLTSGEKGPESI
jgi:hypothetical protein